MPGTDVETRFTFLERLRRLALRRYALFHKAMESYPLHSSIDTLATGRGDRPTSADYSDPDDAVSMGDSEVHRGLSHVDDENDLQGKPYCERSPKCVFQ